VAEELPAPRVVERQGEKAGFAVMACAGSSDACAADGTREMFL
jgi:hypothetical protein